MLLAFSVGVLTGALAEAEAGAGTGAEEIARNSKAAAITLTPAWVLPQAPATLGPEGIDLVLPPWKTCASRATVPVCVRFENGGRMGKERGRESIMLF
jgi:hypothetical protein